jgi:hypothetical protein
MVGKAKDLGLPTIYETFIVLIGSHKVNHPKPKKCPPKETNNLLKTNHQIDGYPVSTLAAF